MSQTYFARRVTLPAAFPTVYRLSDLVRAADSVAPLGGPEVFLANQNGSGAKIARGDATLSSLASGFVIDDGDTHRIEGRSNPSTTDIFVGTDTAGATLFVEIRSA